MKDNRRLQTIADELDLHMKSLQKMRKSELLEVIESLMAVISNYEEDLTEAERDLEARPSKSEFSRLNLQAQGAMKEMDHWRKKFETLQAKVSGRVGFGVKNDGVN